MKKSAVRDQKITMNTILTQIHHLKFSGKYLYSTCLTLCVIMRQPSTHHPTPFPDKLGGENGYLLFG